MMKSRLDSKISRLMFVGLCITFILSSSIMIVAGQGPTSLGAYASSSSASDSDRNYCVTMGYLYRTSPGLNEGQPICQFSDSSWCDANAFATGECAPSRANGFFNKYGIYYPYYYDYPYPYTGLTPGAAVDACTSNGGTVSSVHTPYGDVDVCKFPNGRIVDLYDLYNGAWGNDWHYYAYSWLNPP